jgi:hypothetical protein
MTRKIAQQEERGGVGRDRTISGQVLHIMACPGGHLPKSNTARSYVGIVVITDTCWYPERNQMTPAKTTHVCAKLTPIRNGRDIALTSKYANAISPMNHAPDWHGTSDAVYMVYMK